MLNYNHDKPKKVRRGLYRVTFEKLAEQLNLEHNHHITDIFRSDTDRMNDSVSIIIEGYGMPIHYEGEDLSELFKLPRR